MPEASILTPFHTSSATPIAHRLGLVIIPLNQGFPRLIVLSFHLWRVVVVSIDAPTARVNPPVRDPFHNRLCRYIKVDRIVHREISLNSLALSEGAWEAIEEKALVSMLGHLMMKENLSFCTMLPMSYSVLCCNKGFTQRVGSKIPRRPPA